MLHYRIAFASPWYLAILAVLPVLWYFSYRRLAGLGRARRIAALTLRTLVVALFSLALAEPQMLRSSDRLTVIYLLDQSLSIPATKRRAMIEYVNAEVRKHRGNEDRAGVIVFGRDAAIETPPSDNSLQLPTAVESLLDPEYTNLSAAMKLAQASFPEDAAKRVVLVTDGNQNRGNAIEQAQAMAGAGIGIDVIPVRYQSRAEVAVEHVILPSDVRRDQPFDLRIVLSNDCEAKPGDSGEVRGRLVLSQLIDDRPVVMSDQPVTLPPGKKVFTIRQKIDSPNFYTYEARFIPDRAEDDALPQNNRATAFTHVQGKGQVLLITDAEHPEEHDLLVKRLRLQGLEVTTRTTAALFSSLAELQPYDTVVLANVPRSTNEEISFTDEQIDMLVRNTQQLGAGLVMLGGPNSFGAGGWTGTELEKAMPVDFQIRNAQVEMRGALMMVIDKSGSMCGQKVEACKKAAIEAVKVLSRQDYIGVVAFDTEAYTVVPMQQVGDLQSVLRRIRRLAGNGGTDMRPGMEAGYEALRNVTASVKHMIVLTDGQTAGTGYPELAAEFRKNNITVSTVAVGPDAAKGLMHDIAAAGGGKSYDVGNLRVLPRIFQREACRVARPLIYETKTGMKLQTASLHEILSGIDSLPPITGYVLTNRKDGSLAEVGLLAPQPKGQDVRTVLAAWTYGLGRAIAPTSDDGARWTQAWTQQAVYDKFFGQMVRWSMRPSGGSGKFITTFEPRDGQMHIVVNALDKDDEFLNFLTMTGTVVGPDLKKPITVDIQQSGPGHYVGAFPAREAGSYFVTIDPGRSMAPIRTGVNVPYSDEFRDRVPNETMLRQLAATVPKGGSPGMLIEDPQQPDSFDGLLAVNTFRHDVPAAYSSRDMWHWMLLLAGCTFLGDIFVRRVHVHFGWVPPLAARCRDWVLRRQPAAVQPQYIERLRSRKEEVSGQFEQLRAAMRFEPSPESPVTGGTLDEIASQAPPTTKPAAPTLSPEQQTKEETYTERLLRAKKKALEDRNSTNQKHEGNDR